MVAAFSCAGLAQTSSSSATQYSSSLNNSVQTLLNAPEPADGSTSGMGGGQYQSGYRGPRESNGWAKHLTFEGGVGFTQPLAGASNSVNTAYNITAGVGYNFVPRFGVLGEYSFSRFGLTDQVINSAGTDDGNTHLWSLTLEPIFRYADKGKFGGYVIGGGGFYRELTSFTDPEIGYQCDPFYGCYPVSENYVVSHYSSNQGGVNLGLGFTFKAYPDAKLKLYSEARYEWLDTPNHSTELIPVTFGVRW
jgi:opacity protein-like surface antigen